ncbi:SdpI family protein [Facklamia miroungae]|uniref:Uncharacterized membrane protein n=1 Tax=Facklamia miroungae TaxID=120956 RepID=A0A1G7UIL6_9LACT|nr:SdpI family protein [Facklamia miroungae]NKZ30104.1 DUF1648 domain-containing protein [Facklamia miroungae]SDG46909.1 Uncharacterized membrane protein [Facklamia miroungae]
MMNSFSKYILKNWLLVLISIILAGYFFLNAPETVPTHFDIAGNVDRYGSKTSLLFFPGLMIGLNLLAEMLKHIDPKRENFQRFEKHFYLIIFATNFFFLFTQIVMGAYILNWINQLPSYIEGSLGILFIILGNFMPKIKFNYFMGIRTPWTLANEHVWYHTHRLAGKVFVLMGALIILTILLPAAIKEWAFLVITLGGVIVVSMASYWFYRKEKR